MLAFSLSQEFRRVIVQEHQDFVIIGTLIRSLQPVATTPKIHPTDLLSHSFTGVLGPSIKSDHLDSHGGRVAVDSSIMCTNIQRRQAKIDKIIVATMPMGITIKKCVHVFSLPPP